MRPNMIPQRKKPYELNLSEKTAIANRLFQETPDYAGGHCPIEKTTAGCLTASLDIYAQNVEANEFHQHWEYFNRLCHAILNLHSTGEKIEEEHFMKAFKICFSVLNDSEEMTFDIGSSLIHLLDIFVQDLKESKLTLEKGHLLTLMDHYSKIKMSSSQYEMASQIADHITAILDTFGDTMMGTFDVQDHLPLVGSFCKAIMNQHNDEIMRYFCIRLVYTLNNYSKEMLSAVLAGIRRYLATEDELIALLSQILRKILTAHRYHTQLWILEVVFTLTQNFSFLRIKAYDLLMSMKQRKLLGLGFEAGKLYDLREKFNDIPPHITLESFGSLHEKFDDFLSYLNNVARSKSSIFTVAGKIVQVNETQVNEQYDVDGIEFNGSAGCVSFLADMSEMAKVFASTESQLVDNEGEGYFEAFYENFERKEKKDGTMQINLEIRRLMYKQGVNGQMQEIGNVLSVDLVIGDAKEKGLAYDDSKRLIQSLQEKISTKPVNLNASIMSVQTAASATSLASKMFTPSAQKIRTRIRPKRNLSVAKRSLNFDNMNDSTPDIVLKNVKKMETIKDASGGNRRSSGAKENVDNVEISRESGNLKRRSNEHLTLEELGEMAPIRKKKRRNIVAELKAADSGPRRSKRLSDAANKSKNSSCGESLLNTSKLSSASGRSKKSVIFDPQSPVSAKAASPSKEPEDVIIEPTEAMEVEVPQEVAVKKTPPGKQRRQKIIWSPVNENKDPNVVYEPYVPPPVEFRKMTAEFMATKWQRSMTEEEIAYEKQRDKEMRAEERRRRREELANWPSYHPQQLNLDKDLRPWWKEVKEKQANNETPPFLPGAEHMFGKQENFIRDLNRLHAAEAQQKIEQIKWDREHGIFNFNRKETKERESELERQLSALKEQVAKENQRKAEKAAKKAKLEPTSDEMNNNDQAVMPSAGSSDGEIPRGKLWKPNYDDSSLPELSFNEPPIKSTPIESKKSKCYDPVKSGSSKVKKNAEDVFELNEDEEELPNIGTKRKTKEEPKQLKEEPKPAEQIKQEPKPKKPKRHVPDLPRNCPTRVNWREPEVVQVPHVRPDYIDKRALTAPKKIPKPPKRKYRPKAAPPPANIKAKINFNAADVTLVNDPVKKELLRKQKEELEKAEAKKEFERQLLVSEELAEGKIFRMRVEQECWADTRTGEERQDLRGPKPEKLKKRVTKKPKKEEYVAAPPRPRPTRASKEVAKALLLNCNLSPIGSDDDDDDLDQTLVGVVAKRLNFEIVEGPDASFHVIAVENDGNIMPDEKEPLVIDNNKKTVNKKVTFNEVKKETPKKEEKDSSDIDEKFVTALDHVPRKSNSPITDVNDHYVTAYDYMPRKSDSFKDNQDSSKKSPNASAKRKSGEFDSNVEGSPKKAKLDDVDDEDDPLGEQTVIEHRMSQLDDNLLLKRFIDDASVEEPKQTSDGASAKDSVQVKINRTHLLLDIPKLMSIKGWTQKQFEVFEKKHAYCIVADVVDTTDLSSQEKDDLKKEGCYDLTIKPRSS